MQRTLDTRSRSRRPPGGPARFLRLAAHGSSTAELLCGCQVVTAGGDRIGMVDHLMVDAATHQLRYVVLARRRKYDALVTIPWQALYFDAAKGRLVFYTFQ